MNGIMMSIGSSTLAPLPDVLSHGLVAVSTFGLLSFFCSTSLFLYLSYRLISWHLCPFSSSYIFHSSPVKKPPINQFLFLIYNLLLADIQQSIAFLLNISALRNNGIYVGTTTCFAQGWFVSTGDLASSVFISAIAIHTWLGVVKEYRVPGWAFYGGILGMWAFVYGMAIAGVIWHGRGLYERASAWCWISDAYSSERLWLHYLWIFLCMFSTILIYAYIYLHLAITRRASASSSSPSTPLPTSTHSLMILYPAIYTVCTIPLASGRIAALAGNEVSLGFFCIAGSMIACNGWLDVLLYASTRSEIVFSDGMPGEDVGLDTFAFLGRGNNFGNSTTVQGRGGGRSAETGGRIGSWICGRTREGRERDSRDRRRSVGGESVEELYGLQGIKVKGEVEVSVRKARDSDFGEGGYLPTSVNSVNRVRVLVGSAPVSDMGDETGSVTGDGRPQ